VVCPLVIAELDYLLGRKLGRADARTVLEELGAGSFELPDFELADLHRTLEVDGRYPDLDRRITDSSLVVLAARYDTRDILTLDHRHFPPAGPAAGWPVPAAAPRRLTYRGRQPCDGDWVLASRDTCAPTRATSLGGGVIDDDQNG